MDFDKGGQTSSEQQQRHTAAEIARNKVLTAYSSTVKNLKNLPPSAKKIILKDSANQSSYQSPHQNWMQQPNQSYYQERSAIYSAPNTSNSSTTQTSPPVHEIPNYTAAAENQTLPSTAPTTLKDTDINQQAINDEWKKYHSAWQDYYKNYYSEYYAKAAQSYLATEKMKTERIATGEVERTHKFKHFIPIGIVGCLILLVLFLQYNRLIFTPIMAYISPGGNPSTSIEAIDPTVTGEISPDPRLIIPKLNVDSPIVFGISTEEVDAAMNQGVAQFAIPGANALPGQIGNLAISGHSSGDIYNGNQYKFIFSGLERLAVGDLIYINYNSVRYTYQMTRSEVVEPTDVSALIYETDKPMLTLITCTPLGTSKYRLLITAEQISPNYNGDETTTPEPSVPDSSDSTPSMPANEPSFFEGIWNWLTGK